MRYDTGMNTHEPLYESLDQAAVENAIESLPCPEILERLADFYKVMGDQTRLKILIALEKKELCVSDLCNVIGMSRSAVSHQLKALKAAKLIRSRKDGKAVYYFLDDEHIHSVVKVALTHILEED
ncbi:MULTISPECIES: helix-turn-helix transcriptional regulator [Allobaculum]|uniref:ArsR/SmtB family transcription factor n=2 Tax=Erysipelotrichaceae TaxID=128827 RepID=UPI001E3092C6|nr:MULTISPECIES: metalloregulator ArsR/SmtB family transcription factor [Allobaculum]